jgi:hypothetical protein
MYESKHTTGYTNVRLVLFGDYLNVSCIDKYTVYWNFRLTEDESCQSPQVMQHTLMCRLFSLSQNIVIITVKAEAY